MVRQEAAASFAAEGPPLLSMGVGVQATCSISGVAVSCMWCCVMPPPQSLATSCRDRGCHLRVRCRLRVTAAMGGSGRSLQNGHDLRTDGRSNRGFNLVDTILLLISPTSVTWTFRTRSHHTCAH